MKAALALALAVAAGIAGSRARAGSLAGLHVSVHTVRPGESAESLARAYRINRGTLESQNPNMNLDDLKPGTKIRILSRPGVFQRLNSGLTISDVATAYQKDMQELLDANDITNPRRIPAGIELFVPDGGPLSEAGRARLAHQQRQRVRAARAPRGAFGNPLGLPGRLVMTAPYGRRLNPLTREPQMHTGADFAAPWGTPIVAARDGVVTWAGIKGDYGKLVILGHANGYETWYGHATEILVREGDQVKEGQTIARVGMTGGATGMHLHFEIRHEGSTRNPQRYLARYF